MQGRVSLSTEAGEPLLTETRIRLLEAIGATGALSRAAREVPMSYKGAWDTLETMNRLAGVPLVRRVTGGRRGGGTELTADGMLLVALYRAVERECQEAVRALQHHIERGGGATGFRYLLHRHTLAGRAETNEAEPVRY
ncbi:winged helix-turn-helix domain-containing protein [Pseudothauera rhizosphaerae]|uniref:winged helix-turn-helix domain-containing protein n=1 Tax=Pseudothauera rhizosphaerae TaxID=2565932 RepID=UPI001E5C9A7E|nr:LysR family transcriptional regulator [Pseudothauera rhizosphaerae]